MQSRLLSPFQRLGQKAKKAAQRFVIKTVEKHNVMNASSGGVPDAFSSGLLLSWLSARRPSENEHLPSFQALSIQDYLLTSHPHADFFYHRPGDLAATPWILMGKFEVSVSAWILSNVNRDDRVLILGGDQGYHALTVAKKVESEGKLFVLATSSEDQAVLELNIRSNRLEASTKSALVGTEFLKIFSKTLDQAIQDFRPSKILIEFPGQSGLDLDELNGLGVSEVFIIEHGEVRKRKIGDSTELILQSRKAA
jgi:hypothetical protein